MTGDQAMVEGAVVAKKPKRRRIDRREELIAMRSTPEYKQWLEQAAEQTHHTPTQLMEMGLIEIATKLGIKPPPKR